MPDTQTAETRKSRPRKDPRPRVAYEDAGEVLGKDPDRKYVLVYRPTVERYLQLGWEIDRKRADGEGPRLRGSTAQVGEPLEFSGHVLMSMEKSDYADMEEYGHKDGGAPNGRGQEYARTVEKRILTQTEVRDHLRGLGGNYFKVINEVTGEELTEADNG